MDAKVKVVIVLAAIGVGVWAERRSKKGRKSLGGASKQ